MNKLTIIVIAVISIFTMNCKDSVIRYNPVAEVWFKAGEAENFLLEKIWDKSTDGNLRIFGTNNHNIISGTLFNYNVTGNVLANISNSPSVKINNISGLGMNKIWCAASRDESSGIGRVYFFDGNKLINKTPNIFDPKEKKIINIEYQLFGVYVFKAGSREHRIFVGENGYVLHYIENSSGGIEKNPSWHEYFVSGREDLLGIWGTDASNIWAVGKFGTIYQYKGSFTWEKLVSPTARHIKHIHGYKVSEKVYWYAVGSGGTMLCFDGENIEIVDDILPTNHSFNSIFVLDNRQGIAVGDKGLIYELNPQTFRWEQNTGLTNLDCFGCFITPNGKNKFIIAGNRYIDSGTLFRYFQN